MEYVGEKVAGGLSVEAVTAHTQGLVSAYCTGLDKHNFLV